MVNGVIYKQGDGHLSLAGANWSLAIPTANALAPASISGGFYGVYLVTATIRDLAGNILGNTGTLTIEDTIAPVIDLDPTSAGSEDGTDLNHSVTSTTGTLVSLDDDADPATVVEASDL